jgi:hypothetical protein
MREHCQLDLFSDLPVLRRPVRTPAQGKSITATTTQPDPIAPGCADLFILRSNQATDEVRL